MGNSFKFYFLIHLLVILAFSGSLLAADDQVIGKRDLSEYTSSSNKMVKSYDSCVLSLEAAAEHVDASRLTLPSPQAAQKQPAVGMVQGESKKVPLKFELLSNASFDSHPLVEVPKQSLLLRSSETQHKTIQSLVTFHGVYIAYPLNVATERKHAETFLTEYFAEICPDTDADEVSSECFALVPLNEVKRLEQILSGDERAIWNYVKKGTAHHYQDIHRNRPGTVTTGRGTTYVFGPGGRVQVYGRDGSVRHFSTHLHKSTAFGSHAEILKRQGVLVDPGSNTREALESAFVANASHIDKYMDDESINPSVKGAYRYKLSALGDFSAIEERWRAYHQSNHIKSALSLAQEVNFLPPLLKWSSPASIKPEDGSIRIVRSFIFIRDPKGEETSFQSPNRVWVLHPDALHYQVLHAYFGEFAFELEAADLLAGGHLSYNFNEDTGELEEIELEANGMNGFSNTGLLKLSTNDIEKVCNIIQQDLKALGNETARVSLKLIK